MARQSLYNTKIVLGISLGLFLFVLFSEASESEWKELNQKIADLHAEGNHAEATRVAKKALEVARETYGENHLNVAKSMNNLANLYLLQGKSRGEEAAGLYRKAIAIEEEILGKDHPDLADTLFNFGMLYVFLEQYDQAFPLLELALSIKEKKLGEDHPASKKVREVLEEVKASQTS